MSGAALLAGAGPLWLVGCGNMGGALLARWLACGLPADAVTVVDPAPHGLPENAAIRVVGQPPESDPPAVVVLAVKPQMLGAVAGRIRDRCGTGRLFLSILAGTTNATLTGLFPACGVVRAMPNTPARIGQGTTALFSDTASAAERALAEALMAAAGHVHWLPDEALFDTVTAVSGSGPAYLFRFVEALDAAAVANGLPPALASALARETVVGAAGLVADCSASPAVLRAEVTSPGGTTQAGLEVLDGKGDLSDLLTRTVQAAAARARELGRMP